MFTKANRAINVRHVPLESLDLDRKKVVVVGGTDGLGRAIANAAAARKAHVTVAGRTFRDASSAPANLDFAKADLSTVAEAKRLASALPAGDVDVLVLTTGIMPGATKVVSAEGIEIDMAVSALSRAVLLKELGGKLKAGSRVFVMGFPGAGQSGDPSDLNSDKKYEGGLGFSHMQTVAVNEALVHHYAALLKDKGVGVYGLNPGLIQTNIRAGAMGGTVFGWVFETLTGLFSVSPATYASNVLPLFTAPELAAHSGALFGQDGAAILPTPSMTDAAYTAQFIKGLDELQARAEAAGKGAGVGAGAKLA
jgi:NAD(P)-dependent dehydrogenase (short-subunit alcohol dehydrogenase family)